MLGEGLLIRPAQSHRKRVDEAADLAVKRHMIAARDGNTEHDVVAVAAPPQHHLPGSQQNFQRRDLPVTAPLVQSFGYLGRQAELLQSRRLVRGGRWRVLRRW